MLMLLIYITLKKFFSKRWSSISVYSKKITKSHFFYWLILFSLFINPTLLLSQNSQLHYKVLFNGNDVGWMRLEKNISGNKAILSLVSEIKTKIIFPITIFNKDISTFENGKLVYSSQLRKTNGSTKLDKQTKLVGNEYEVIEDGEKDKLPYPPIDTNLLSLYFQEPASLKSVYCDKRESFVKPIITKDGGYRLKFSNGNSNCFYYNKDGLCTKVKIEHLFYSAELIFAY